MAEGHSPLEQFKIVRLVDMCVGGTSSIDADGKYHCSGLDLSFTNSALYMVVAIALITLFLTASMRSRALVPGRWQSMAELAYEFIANMIRENVGNEGKKYFPFIFSLFMFVLFANVLGLIPIPGKFTVTSHIIVTFSFAAVVFVGVTAIGFMRHGVRFFHFFFPSGAPLWTAPVLIPIEIISYLSRPISLSVRLFANMTVGHVILEVIAGFMVTVGILAILPGTAFLVVFTGLEIGIACLQAYIFTILSCVYLNDAIHMH